MSQWATIAVVSAFWTAFVVYWVIAARRVRPNKRLEPAPSRRLSVILFCLTWVMLIPGLGLGPLGVRWIEESPSQRLLALVLTVGGFGLMFWARATLGMNWSGQVTIKTGHELVKTGPYVFVRNPIYTGNIVALMGAATLLGETRGLVAVALLTLTFLIKMRREERWLTEEFGEAYTSYRHRVRGLIPFVL
jgi:protein-S-isoprenylcysteine O-methyltransferase Ste14